jgi:lipoprotein
MQNKSIFSSLFICCALTACSSIAKKAPEPHAVSTEATTTAATAGNTPKLSVVNQELLKACSNQDQQACIRLVQNLGNECKQGQAQSCVDLAFILTNVNSQATKSGNKQLAMQSYQYTVGALTRACMLKNQSACQVIERLNNSIYSKIKSLKTICHSKGDKKACAIVHNVKKQLQKTCQAGYKQDCIYLDDLQK